MSYFDRWSQARHQGCASVRRSTWDEMDVHISKVEKRTLFDSFWKFLEGFRKIWIGFDQETKKIFDRKRKCIFHNIHFHFTSQNRVSRKKKNYAIFEWWRHVWQASWRLGSIGLIGKVRLFTYCFLDLSRQSFLLFWWVKCTGPTACIRLWGNCVKLLIHLYLVTFLAYVRDKENRF